MTCAGERSFVVNACFSVLFENNLSFQVTRFTPFLKEEDASLLKFNVNDLDLDESSEESESETVHKPPAELEVRFYVIPFYSHTSPMLVDRPSLCPGA